MYTYIYIRRQSDQLKIRLGILLLTSFVPHNLYGAHQIKLPNAKITTLHWYIGTPDKKESIKLQRFFSATMEHLKSA